MATAYLDLNLEAYLENGTGVPDFSFDNDADINALTDILDPWGPSPELEIVSVASDLIAITITSIDPITGLPAASPSGYIDFNVNNLSDIGSVADFEAAMDDMLVTGGLESLVFSDDTHTEVFTINFPGTPASNPDRFMFVAGDQSIEFDIDTPNSFQDLFDLADALSTAADYAAFDALSAADQTDIITILEGAGLTDMRIVDDGTTVLELSIGATEISLTVGDYTLTLTADDMPFSTYWEMVQAMRDIDEDSLQDVLDGIDFQSATLTGSGGVMLASITMGAGETLSENTVLNMTIEGTSGDDIIESGEGDDLVFGRAGNDEIFGQGGNDRLYGGADNDTLDGGAGDDTLYGASGNDELIGWTGDDTLNGGSGNDCLDGWTGDDTLNGGSGNDSLDGWTGDDTLNGESGNDELIGWMGDDTLNGGTGHDFLDGEQGNDRLDGGTGDDLLYGGLGNDILLGRSGTDELRGGLAMTGFMAVKAMMNYLAATAMIS